MRRADADNSDATSRFVDPRESPFKSTERVLPRTTTEPTALTELHRLCRENRIYDVERWIAARNPLQMAAGLERKGQSTSALEIALEARNHALVLLLLCNGYDPNLERKCPLDPALRSRRWDLLDLLLEWGADPKSMSVGDLFDTYKNEMAAPTRDAMSVITETPSGCLHNFRALRGKRFAERDRLVFNAIAPHIFQAYSNTNAFWSVSRRVEQLSSAIEKRTRAVVLLTLDSRVAFASQRAAGWVRGYFGDFVSDRLPEAIDLWRRRQLEKMRIVDDVVSPAESLRASGPAGAIVVRLSRVPDGWLLLLEKESQQLDASTLRSLPISKREAEVLAYVANGKTNPEIAIILGISRLTVKKHIERIFQSLSVETRTAAAAVALETANAHR